jgi:hypothetical protein
MSALVYADIRFTLAVSRDLYLAAAFWWTIPF